SRIYGVDQSSLVRENGLVPPYALKPGQRLTLPGRIEANLAEMPPEQQHFTAPTSPNAGTGGSMSVEELPPTTAPQAPKQQPPKQPPAELRQKEPRAPP